MSSRWVLYSHDADELVTTTCYRDPEKAAEDAARLNDVIVVRLDNLEVDEDDWSEPEEIEDANHE